MAPDGVASLRTPRERNSLLNGQNRSGPFAFVTLDSFSPLGNKTIPATLDGFDKLRPLGVVAESLAKHFDIECETAFLDEALLPELLHQLVLFDQVAGVFKKHQSVSKTFGVSGTTPPSPRQLLIKI